MFSSASLRSIFIWKKEKQSYVIDDKRTGRERRRRRKQIFFFQCNVVFFVRSFAVFVKRNNPGTRRIYFNHRQPILESILYSLVSVARERKKPRKREEKKKSSRVHWVEQPDRKEIGTFSNYRCLYNTSSWGKEGEENRTGKNVIFSLLILFAPIDNKNTDRGRKRTKEGVVSKLYTHTRFASGKNLSYARLIEVWNGNGEKIFLGWMCVCAFFSLLKREIPRESFSRREIGGPVMKRNAANTCRGLERNNKKNENEKKTKSTMSSKYTSVVFLLLLV